MSKIGLFGGSFNPIHNGHIHLAETIKSGLALDKVIFIPSNIPPHKDGDEYAPNEHRLKMCRLAVSGIDPFEVSDYELLRDEVSYTVNTVRYFKDKNPQDELYLLLGSDMLLDFDTWYRYDEILQKASLAVASREKNDEEKLKAEAEKLSKFGKIYIIDAPAVEVSSTEIRKKLRNNENITCNLSEKVVKYILLNGLYKN